LNLTISGTELSLPVNTVPQPRQVLYLRRRRYSLTGKASQLGPMPWTPVYRLDAIPGAGVAVFILAVPNERVTEPDSSWLGASRMARHRAVHISDPAADPASVSARSVGTVLPQPPTGRRAGGGGRRGRRRGLGHEPVRTEIEIEIARCLGSRGRWYVSWATVCRLVHARSCAQGASHQPYAPLR
jgi:hypothetical protein